MKQFFLLFFTLLVVSHIYSTDVSNSVTSKATATSQASSSSQLASKANTNNQNKVLSNAEKHLKPKSKDKKKKKKVKIVRIKRKTFKNPIAVIKTGWLKVSTKMFRNTSKFPPILLPNGKEITIKVNKKYFRLNHAYVKGSKSSELPPKRKYFWFRLSGKNLYYSMTKSDINILGTVTVRNIITSYASQDGSGEQNCFKVVDKSKRNWKLCAENAKLRGEWICKIKDILGKPDRNCANPNLGNTVVIERKITQPIILIPLASPKCNENWDYQLKGSDWNCECSEGKEQSPINLPDRNNALQSPIRPIFQYEEVLTEEEAKKDELFGEEKINKPLQLKYDNGLLRIKYDNFGKLVTLDGAVYFAEEIVFHTPAEHTIQGKKYDMEMQIIHYGRSKGDIAKQVVVSFLFEKQPGASNQFIDSLDYLNLPSTVNKVRTLKEGLHIPKIFYSEHDKEFPLMKPFSFYTYQGSLTSPPCTQRTINYVASQPIKIGTTALQLFQEAIRMPDLVDKNGNVIQSPILPENARRVQPLNGRAIFFFDHVKYCGPNPTNKKLKKKGHYEKVIKKKVDYFFVNGQNPSGLPGAFVVTPKEALGKQ